MYVDGGAIVDHTVAGQIEEMGKVGWGMDVLECVSALLQAPALPSQSSSQWVCSL